MGMTIEAAILDQKYLAESQEATASMYEKYKNDPAMAFVYRECASDHRQVAAWLSVLKQLQDSGSCNDCANKSCLHKPELGQLVRYNCPFYLRKVTDSEDKNTKVGEANATD